MNYNDRKKHSERSTVALVIAIIALSLSMYNLFFT